MTAAPSRWARVFALDLRSLALFRIGLALCLLLDVITRWRDARAFLTDAGAFPRSAWFASPLSEQLWSFHAATGSLLGQRALLVAGAAVAVALLVGWRARTAAFVALVLWSSLQNRNLAVFYGFDLLLRASLLWACFLPLGARFSLDTRAPSESAPPAAAPLVMSAGTVALTLQAVVVYVTSGLQKLQDASWRDLSALFYGLTTDHHATPLARWLAGHVDLTRALSLLVLLLELAAPLLLLALAFIASERRRARVRAAVIATFALFHVGTACLFTLGLFPIVGVVAWLPFLPSSVWRASASANGAVAVERNRAAAAGAVVAGLFVLAFNVESVTGARLLPSGLRAVGLAARFDQNWNMFERTMADGWFIAAATLDDGHRVDLLRQGAPVSFTKPADVSGAFPSMRWRKYVTNLVRPGFAPHRRHFLRSLCRDSGARAVELVFVRELEHIDGTAPSTSSSTLASRVCKRR